MNQAKATLLVDDNDELREATREHLEDRGYAVTAAASGEDALRTAAAAPGALALLVSDVYMPGMNGVELADRLLQDDPEMAVLLISSRGGESEIRRRLAAGDVAFLAKPFSPGELAAKVEEAFERAGRRAGAAPRMMPAPPPAMAEPRSEPAGKRAGISKGALQLAAALVAMVGLGVAFGNLDLGAPPLPMPVEGSVTRSATIEAVAPLGRLAEAPPELVWRPAAGAASYSLSLRTIDGTALWQAEVAGPPADLPPEAVAALHRAVTYYWSVEALDAEGRLMARSELAPFVVELARRPASPPPAPPPED